MILAVLDDAPAPSRSRSRSAAIARTAIDLLRPSFTGSYSHTGSQTVTTTCSFTMVSSYFNLLTGLTVTTTTTFSASTSYSATDSSDDDDSDTDYCRLRYRRRQRNSLLLLDDFRRRRLRADLRYQFLRLEHERVRESKRRFERRRHLGQRHDHVPGDGRRTERRQCIIQRDLQ